MTDCWMCSMCGTKYASDIGECLECGFPYLGYFDQIGGYHEGGCGTMPDGTDCGECSKGDCTFCGVWVTHKRRIDRYIAFNCPECGEKLEIWYEQITETIDGSAICFPYEQVDLIYHCNNCGCDWDSVWETQFGDTMQTPLKRHYWG